MDAAETANIAHDNVTERAWMEMAITEDERQFMRHALGLTRQKLGYRNFYRAGGDDAKTGKALVAKGMAIYLAPTEGFPDPCFLISSRGFDACAEPGESMDREEQEKLKRIDAKAFVGASCA